MYKVEDYVEKCLRSLEDQDISQDDYEIICINDGSPDNCSTKVRKLQREFNNILLIEQENRGVSSARNNGIDCASGKYIIFIDPDDYVDTNSFGRILRICEDRKSQVLFLGFTILKNDGTIQKKIFNDHLTDKVYSGTEAYFVSRGNGRTDPDRMWAIMFETSFLMSNDLKYMVGVPYLEDGEFIARILCLADRCAFDRHSFYQRTTRPGSATNSSLFHSDKATGGFLLAAGNLKRFQEGQKLNELQRKFLNQPISKFILLAINSSITTCRSKKLSQTINALNELKFRRIDLEGCDWEYRFCGFAYNLSPWLGAIATVLYPRMKKITGLMLKD